MATLVALAIEEILSKSKKEQAFMFLASSTAMEYRVDFSFSFVLKKRATTKVSIQRY